LRFLAFLPYRNAVLSCLADEAAVESVYLRETKRLRATISNSIDAQGFRIDFGRRFPVGAVYARNRSGRGNQFRGSRRWR
jgi:hypothetical protein